MEKPCCVGVVRNANGLKGIDSVIEGIPVYTGSPKGNRNDVGVIVIHDIFGFALPNCKYIVDHLACNGFEAVMADFFRGDNWPASESEILEPLSGDKFGSWFEGITSTEFWNGRFKSDIKTLSEQLQSKGCLKIGVIGFCWGGLAAIQSSTLGLVDAAFSIHGAGHDLEQYKATKCPVSYITITGDDFFDEATQKQLQDAGAYVEVLDDLYHGFAVRGDFGGNEHVRKSAEQSLLKAMKFFVNVANSS